MVLKTLCTSYDTHSIHLITYFTSSTQSRFHPPSLEPPHSNLPPHDTHTQHPAHGLNHRLQFAILLSSMPRPRSHQLCCLTSYSSTRHSPKIQLGHEPPMPQMQMGLHHLHCLLLSDSALHKQQFRPTTPATMLSPTTPTKKGNRTDQPSTLLVGLGLKCRRQPYASNGDADAKPFPDHRSHRPPFLLTIRAFCRHAL